MDASSARENRRVRLASIQAKRKWNQNSNPCSSSGKNTNTQTNESQNLTQVTLSMKNPIMIEPYGKDMDASSARENRRVRLAAIQAKRKWNQNSNTCSSSGKNTNTQTNESQNLTQVTLSMKNPIMIEPYGKENIKPLAMKRQKDKHTTYQVESLNQSLEERNQGCSMRRIALSPLIQVNIQDRSIDGHEFTTPTSLLSERAFFSSPNCMTGFVSGIMGQSSNSYGDNRKRRMKDLKGKKSISNQDKENQMIPNVMGSAQLSCQPEVVTQSKYNNTITDTPSTILSIPLPEAKQARMSRLEARRETRRLNSISCHDVKSGQQKMKGKAKLKTAFNPALELHLSGRKITHQSSNQIPLYSLNPEYNTPSSEVTQLSATTHHIGAIEPGYSMIGELSDGTFGKTSTSSGKRTVNKCRRGKNISQPLSVLESISRHQPDFDSDRGGQHHTNEESVEFEVNHADGRGSSHHLSPFVSQMYASAEVEELLDFGDATYTCGYCNSIMWYEERSEKSRQPLNPEFSICCMRGKVDLPILLKPPTLLLNLISGVDPRSKNFKENIRAYNSLFSFTSLGGKIQTGLNDGNGPPNFILNGQNYHRMGSLIPPEGAPPKFAQLYIYDTQNETDNRMRHFRSDERRNVLDPSLVKDLTEMIDIHNPVAKLFRRVRDFANHNEGSNFYLRLFRRRNKDPRVYNLPTSDEVAGLIVGDIENLEAGRDIIVKKQSGELVRIPEYHVSFLPLQYPMLFPYGEDGFQDEIPVSEAFSNDADRKRLFQQFIVDCYTMIEAQRMTYYRRNQDRFRSDILSGLEDAIYRGDIEPSSAGQRIILPSSFTGGTRYMFNNCQDAMAICKRFGYPDLFITMTCNTAWDEIRNFLSVRGQRPDERPDILSRVFKMKLDQFLTDLKKNNLFGEAEAGMYTVEFQKRGLPHAHILLWLKGEAKLKTTDDIDRVISAELPHPDLYPNLYAAVSNFMIHGPCGAANKYSPCMKDGVCSKRFPKKFQNRTVIDDDGFPKYRRRNNGISIIKKDVEIDNTYVVPYNPTLLMRYKAHINVEYCNKSNAIKYLFKYVNKGPDRVTVEIAGTDQSSKKENVRDEIKHYYDCRYLSPCEAIWKTFKFDIHERWPPVYTCNFHLPSEQSVTFMDHERIDAVVARHKELETMFTSWFSANREHPEGRHLTYAEFPTMFVYDPKKKEWRLRQQGFSIGRLRYIPPQSGELFYLRILLTVQKGCTSFESIRTVDGVLHNTYQDACDALGLLKDDKEYINAIKETSDLGSGQQLRKLFAHMLFMSTLSKPYIVWESTWKLLSDGLLYERRRRLGMPELRIEDEELENLTLIEIEKLLQNNGRSLKDFECFPCPDISEMLQFDNKFIADELNYNRAEQAEKHMSLLNSLNDDQRNAYNQIMDAVFSESGGFFFLYGYGGTGKTFVWNTLSAALRSQHLIVVNVASSGIASLLLPGGRTAHSRFCIPIGAHEYSTCNIKQGSLRAKLLQHASLIIWDEAPMMNRYCFEALDRTLRDLMSIQDKGNAGKPFGGKVVVLGGDFRQILPVIKKGSRHDIISATINSSDIWKHCQVLKLNKNMRLSSSSSSDDLAETTEFAKWILNIGDGCSDCNEYGEYDVTIPEELLILESEDPLRELINYTYPDINNNMNNFKYFEERAILCPTLDAVHMVNEFVLSTIPGEETEYLSSDSSCPSDADSEIRSEWFTTEFLNDIKCSGVPNHSLKLKAGVPIMLLRNIDQSSGLCNGTRLIVNRLGKNVIAATVITGTNVGDKVFIPRMSLVPSDPEFPFKFERRQFPISLCFAMTINKSQGQSLSNVGLFLPKPVFTHGQLYVAVSRVKTKKGLKILSLDEKGKMSKSTKNVVYNEVFDTL
ncbi:uncharacterized protein LOC130746488 isoform X2 [Lotus japonicus]|uniref:uncharacterized protein LOC130746488 isoform X2 n=1 Tax=Lotus japonicus TaxID=34305 RepID=UPI00259103E4|nr:uncharacterized protein LOC130746488 isoform X2 [Lotus japonicus]